MPSAPVRFGDFQLDQANRQLLRDGESVALNARYFDALAVLVEHHGQLVSKQALFDRVWSGSVVTDSALTQCIKEIRRVLGDDASQPRFVRTVAGHGYAFIAEVSPLAEAVPDGSLATPERDAQHDADNSRSSAPTSIAPHWLADTTAAIAGGAVAGLLGGVLYGSLLAVAPTTQAVGSLSVLLVMVALCLVVGMTGALGVGLGISLGHRVGGSAGTLLGAAIGGVIIGGLSKLLSADAFTLLVGSAPIGTTGGLEGAVIGLSVALGLLAGGGFNSARPVRSVGLTALSCAIAGLLLQLLGGRLMAGSLALVAQRFDHSRIDVTPLARLFGQVEFGSAAQAALASLEAAVFGGCVVGALLFARRRMR